MFLIYQQIWTSPWVKSSLLWGHKILPLQCTMLNNVKLLGFKFTIINLILRTDSKLHQQADNFSQRNTLSILSSFLALWRLISIDNFTGPQVPSLPSLELSNKINFCGMGWRKVYEYLCTERNHEWRRCQASASRSRASARVATMVENASLTLKLCLHSAWQLLHGIMCQNRDIMLK